ncbi:MAG: beta-lactamase family protein [Intrasporangiaceae bacterium]|nr:beta-lactamase family protein [Intrasporangiaceae bacterium]
MDPADTRYEELAARLEAATEKVRKRYVGIAVGALADGVKAEVGVGVTRTDGHAVHGQTSFQIGSVTKVFTALVLADAVHRGEVALDQRLDSIIPETASHPDGRPITLADLATHTAGLPRLPPGFQRQTLRNRKDPYAHFGADELIDALGRPPKRPPGRVRYSNYGAGTLGEALTRALDAPFDELVAERITGPLGMRRTDSKLPSDADNGAEGHVAPGKPVPDWHFTGLAGAGALRSTLTDLLVFLDAHLHPTESPLAAAINLAMPPREQARGPMQTALGWHVRSNRDGTARWMHDGRTSGFASFVGFDPEAQTGVAVLANTSRPVGRLGTNLLKAIHPR